MKENRINIKLKFEDSDDVIQELPTGKEIVKNDNK